MADDIQLHFIVLYVGDDDVLYVCQLINSCDYICMFDILPLFTQLQVKLRRGLCVVGR